MKKIVSTAPLQACRTCEHGRKLHEIKFVRLISRPRCDKGHYPAYHTPEHEHDDQHGYYRHCADWQCRTEVIDAEEEDNV